MTTTRVFPLIALLGTMSYAAGVPAQTIIKLGTIAPEQSVWHDALLEIRQQWRDITNGEVELRIYAGGVLGGEDEMVRKLQRRGLDALAISGAGLPLIDGIVACLNLPLLFDSYAQLARVRDAVSDELEQSFEQRGYKVLGWSEAGWVRFFAKSPVRTPEDLRQQRLWISTGDPSHEQLLNQFGFRVVALPATDMLTGLQTGLIEAIDVPPLFALLDRSYQEASYMTTLNFMPLNAATVISLQAWERIDENYRAELLAAVQTSSERLREALHRAEQEAIDEMVARGLQRVELAEPTIAEWKELAESAFPALSCSQNFPRLFERIVSTQRADAGVVD